MRTMKANDNFLVVGKLKNMEINGLTWFFITKPLNGESSLQYQHHG